MVPIGHRHYQLLVFQWHEPLRLRFFDKVAEVVGPHLCKGHCFEASDRQRTGDFFEAVRLKKQSCCARGVLVANLDDPSKELKRFQRRNDERELLGSRTALAHEDFAQELISHLQLYILSPCVAPLLTKPMRLHSSSDTLRQAPP